MLHRGGHAGGHNLRIAEDLIHAVDRSARHTSRIEQVDPLGTGAGSKGRAKLDIERLPIARPIRALCKTRIRCQCGLTDHVTDLCPHGFACGTQIHIAIGGGIGGRRHAGRMVVADLPRHLAIHQKTRGLKIHQSQARLQERRLHPLPAPTALALIERGHDAERRIQASGDIHHRSPYPHRAFAGLAGHRHHAGHALCNLVEARPHPVRPFLPETRNAGQNDARVDRRKAVVIDAQPGLHIGTVIFDDHIGRAHQAMQHGFCTRGFEVERDQSLVAMKVEHVGAIARTGHQFGAARVGGRFDPDDIGAKIGELLDAGRA